MFRFVVFLSFYVYRFLWSYVFQPILSALHRQMPDDLFMISSKQTLSVRIFASLRSASISAAGGIIAVLPIGVSVLRTHWRGGWASPAIG